VSKAIEVITSVERRRRWSTAEKERLVAASLEPGASVSAVAREAGIHASQLYGWRRQLLRRSQPGGELCSSADCGGTRADWVAGSRPDRGRVREWIAAADHRNSRSGHADHDDRDARGRAPAMISLPAGARVWLATGHTDMRKGFDGLALLVQETLKRNPHTGHLFVFRGRRGSLIKVLWHDGQGMCLFAKRLERGRFVWPSTVGRESEDRTVTITPAQLGYLLEGIDWRLPQQTWRPQAAG
jgi:transposase